MRLFEWIERMIGLRWNIDRSIAVGRVKDCAVLDDHLSFRVVKNRRCHPERQY